MKIAITGVPAAHALEIAEALAERFGLNLITTSKDMSAEDVICVYEDTDDTVLLTQFACLLDTDLNVCLYDSLTIDPTFPKTYHDTYTDSLKRGREELGIENIYDPKFYKLTINRAGLKTDAVCNSIVTLLQKGLLGDFVSPYSVIPDSMITSGVMKPYALSKAIPTVNYKGCLYMFGDYADAASCVEQCGVIPVKYVDDRVPELRPLAEYSDWFTYLNGSCDQLKLQHALARFCKEKNYADADDVLLMLSANGDPWNKLSGLGYL